MDGIPRLTAQQRNNRECEGLFCGLTSGLMRRIAALNSRERHYDAGVSSGRWRQSLNERLTQLAMGPEVLTRRMLLRPLRPSDAPAWQEVRRRCEGWLTKWEPARPVGSADAVSSRRIFENRCEVRDRERAAGTAVGFAMFYDGRFVGECNLNNIARGAMQSASIGYWIDEMVAGLGLTGEAVVGVMSHAFETLGLHRVEIAIVPRNAASIRVVEKLGLRQEGIAERLIEINGVWEDHLRFAMTVEEWHRRVPEFRSAYLDEGV